MGTSDKTVTLSRFSVGQRVSLSATRFERVPIGSYRIVAQLPAEAGEHQYRVKHEREAFERRVGEYRLTLAA